MLLRKSAAWVNPSDDEDFRSFGDSLYKVRKNSHSRKFWIFQSCSQNLWIKFKFSYFGNRLSHPIPILEIPKVIPADPCHGQPPRRYHDWPYDRSPHLLRAEKLAESTFHFWRQKYVNDENLPERPKKLAVTWIPSFRRCMSTPWLTPWLTSSQDHLHGRLYKWPHDPLWPRLWYKPDNKDTF